MNYDDHAFAGLKALEEAANPKWLREIRELKEAMNAKWLQDSDEMKRLFTPAHLAVAKTTVADLAIGKAILTDKIATGKYATETVAMQKVLGETFAAQRALDDAAGKVIGNVCKMQELLRPHHELFADLLRPFDRFEEMFKPALPMSVADGLAQHFQKTALPLASLVAMPWSKPLTFLTAAEEFRGASLAWPNESAGAEIAMMIGPRKAEFAPNIVIEVKLACLLCGDPIFHRSERFEWVAAENRGLYQTEVLPLCPRCLREDPPSYVERLVDALQAPRRPRLTVIEGGGESSGKHEGSEHLRLVADRTEDDTGEES